MPLFIILSSIISILIILIKFLSGNRNLQFEIYTIACYIIVSIAFLYFVGFFEIMEESTFGKEKFIESSTLQRIGYLLISFISILNVLFVTRGKIL